jgi:sortase A
MRLARLLGAIGRTCITAGTLILLFVAYQLWGTGLHEARSQNQLEKTFDSQLTSTTTTAPGSPSTTLAPAPPPADGEAVAHIVIPKIGVDKIVVEGVSLPQLKKGPGHYPGTPLPGQPGNAAIAGHRTTYGAPFGNLDQLIPGDEILVTTLQGEFRYEVMDQTPEQGQPPSGWVAVRPTQIEVLDNVGDNRLTLTSCHPKYSARQRIIVTAALVDKPAPAPPPLADAPPPPPAIDDIDGVAAPRLPAILWGLVAALIWIASWRLGKLWRKWPAYFIGLPFFGVALFFFFDNFARLLPSNY